MFRFNFLASFIFIVFALVLGSQLQSCGGSEGSEKSDRGIASVTSPYGFANQEATSLLLVDTAKDFTMEGFCEAEADKALSVSWTLLDLKGKKIGSGESECRSGKYKFLVQGIENIQCQEKYWLKTELDNASSVYKKRSELTKICPPINRKPAFHRGSQQCFFEGRFLSGKTRCVRSCYLNNVVKSQKIVEEKSCDLAMSATASH